MGESSRESGLLGPVMQRARLLEISPSQIAVCVAAARAVESRDARALACLLLVLEGARSRGSTCVQVSALDGGLQELGIGRPERTAWIEAVIGGAFGSLLAIDVGRLYTRRALAEERRLLTELMRRQACAASGEVEQAIVDVLARPRRLSSGDLERLTDEQVTAVRTASSGGLSVITGGPGTGKTSIVVSMLRVFVRLGIEPESIALAAPTGRAADRLGRSIETALQAIEGPSEQDLLLLQRWGRPRTLHRLLGWSPELDGFRYHARNPLPSQRVVVDESSMMDASMADALLSALLPTASMSWMGDSDQLPAVSPGAPFAEWVSLGNAVRLTRSFRAASDQAGASVLEVAGFIREGRAAEAFEAMQVRSRASELLGAGVEWLSFSALDDFLDEWHRRHVAPVLESVAAVEWEVMDGRLHPVEAARQVFRGVSSARLMTATKVGPMGSESVGRALSGRSDFAAGDPVLVTRNDYARGLVNGDLGVVLRARHRGRERLVAAFERGPGEVAVYPLESVLGLLELAYASTVHRAQGQEHDFVALLLGETPEGLEKLISRSLVYTAVTRARRSVVVVGERRAFEDAVKRVESRESGLSERIRQTRGLT